jgi:hypothetical protein
MKKFVAIILLNLFVFNPLLMAQSIKDVPKSDASYSAVKKAVGNGYLSLYGGSTFNGSRAVSRKEMAVIIDKFLKKIDQQGLNLKKSDIQELVQLGKSFKSHLTTVEGDINRHNATIRNVSDEQKTINHDVSEINESLQKELSELKEQQTYMWIGIGAAAALGLIIK